VSGSTFTLEGPGATPVAANVTYSAGTMTATLDPTATLAENTTYTARLLAGIQDGSANPLAPVTWTFTTGTTPVGAVFRSASSGSNATATTLVIAKPAGVVAGDALLASVAVRGNPVLTPPAGWTLVRLDLSGGTIRQAIYVRIAGASEPVSYTFTLSNAQSAAGGIVAYSGVDPTTPIDAHGGQINASSTSLTAPSITTTGANRMLVAFYAIPNLTTYTAPAGMTERFDQQVPAANQYKVTASGHDQLLLSGGATGTRVATVANSAVSVGQLVALRPGASGPPPPDTTPPTVTNRTPTPSAVDVAIGTNVTATFSEAVTGVSDTTFTLEGPGATPVSASVSYNPTTRVATLDPASDLAHSTTYTARLTAGITDTSPNANALVPLNWTFTTVAAPPVDTTPPTVTNRTPGVGATDVAIGTNVTATFSEDVTGVSGTTFTLEGPGSTAVPAAVTYDAGTRVATLNPNANLANDTTYTATLTSGITDTSPNANALVQVQWTFTTAATPPAGAIEFRGASSANNTTATTIVLPKPAGVVSGDAMLAAVAFRGNPTITPPAGWTLVRQDINGNTHRQAIFVRVAGGSEPASFTFTLSSAQSAAGGIVAYSGVDPNTPVDVHGGQVNASSTSATAPSVTTTGPDRMLVAFYATPNLTTFTAPSGMAERYDQQVPAANQYKVTASGHDQEAPGSGATGTRVATVANSAASVGQLVALLPASGG
jgi:hypothetical protein